MTLFLYNKDSARNATAGGVQDAATFRTGMTLDEASQILNVKKNSPATEDIAKVISNHL